MTASPSGVNTAEAQALIVIRRSGSRVTHQNLGFGRAVQSPCSTLDLMAELRQALLSR
ncbi:hypothetical protein K7W42_00840 [Deinococcus sp. HMF7604]|uniref:hypothetical protein n=1 Tax=Deinococcus betulae TaxID=2873312 RepID=UPI001CCFEB8C|nr:hypothetical protein [Deinococcus betulae]MBZ9749398.1 hypothetical protein [Deinococcus betulae]